MMNEQTWNGWIRDWEWMLASMRRKGAWEVSDLTIDPPVSRDDVSKLQEKDELVLPREFIEVLTRFSSRVGFSWDLNDPSDQWWVRDPPNRRPAFVLPKPYYQIDSGGGTLWIAGLLGHFTGHVEGYPSGPREDAGTDTLVWQDKTAFIETGNGDLIAFDVSRGDADCPVVYLDHEHGPLHGARLGLNFVEFMTRWSNLGCPGPEIWAMEPFYDPVQNLLMDSGEVVENWKRWVNE